ncbi:MAG: hypothetical protein COU11_04010 [Candidatus Harrisonbacteria bacterium CG10_big_fil_rev_8_21_14_0_10_49_15]|uniref:Baseplate protein J-like domain-containing protein n=1 Tax=Candidatus Harrisonbacteria bacterium CG10_big_fil_rev_8_21_14_0_10_49_15 TaxID=1974587 RepID=A0A2H0UJS5_9BACT|nr:MAG: hypothetical protein COU11_04010 [Candidatus Harrisonbacteria bacterium CG10_big_fil_rev_8_21_14_0_10_49_15]
MVTKKIIVNKNDEPTLIAEKLIDTEADTVIFSIPRFSRLGESSSNFKLIKREAEVLDKQVLIESVDEEVLTHAAAAGIEAINPFLEQRRQRVSDIRMDGPRPPRSNPEPIEVDEEPEPEEEAPEEVEEAMPIPVRVSRRSKSATPAQEPEVIHPEPVEVVIGPGVAFEETTEVADAEEEEEKAEWERGEPIRPVRRRRFRGSFSRGFSRRHLILGISIIALAGFIYLGVAVLPRAEATIVTTKEPWTFAQPVTVDNTATEVNSAEKTIPGQVFIKREATTMKFPATGKKFVERKATGELTIYNEHSSKSQPLVVNTRFQTPSGQIYRLKSGVVVPGAKVENGQIAASSITVTVIADEAGPTYNVGPVPRLSIPGFAGDEKFNDFYGELKAGATGGFVGESQVPTEKDLSTAKLQSANTAEQTLRRQLDEQIPEGFTVLDGATKFTIFKQAIDASVDNQNNFTILTEAQLSTLAFREADIRSLAEAQLAAAKETRYMVWSDKLDYGALRVDNPAAGKMIVPVEYIATLAQEIDTERLSESLMGKSEEELRSIILSLPGAQNARVSLWPFWVRTVPNDTDRIEITLE